LVVPDKAGGFSWVGGEGFDGWDSNIHG
jgi:hypothetical protein